MDAKDNLFAHAAISYGYISQEKMDGYQRELFQVQQRGQNLSLEEYLVAKKILTLEKITEIYSQVSQSLPQQELQQEPHSKTLTFMGQPSQINMDHSFTLTPTPNSSSNPINPGQDSVFLGNAIGQKLGRYTITGRLGRGGMGIVYKAKDSILGRSVAVKVLISSDFDPSHTERFKREAQTAASLNHPNIVQIHDIAKLGNNDYFVMEYIDGKSLSQIIKEESKLEEKRAIEIVKKVANALNEAHKLNIVHRDIKPANIMISKENKPKVADFGLAKLPLSTSLSQSGQVMGTPSYMSPEQVEGKPVDNRSDLYSLGITFYEMLSGEQPFKGDNLYNIMMAHVHKEPKPIRNINAHISPELALVVHKMMARNPQDRFQDGKQIVEILDYYLSGSNKPIANLHPQKKRSLFFKICTIIFMIMVTGVALVNFYPDHKVSQKIAQQWQTVYQKIQNLQKKPKSPEQKSQKARKITFIIKDIYNTPEDFRISFQNENGDIIKVTDNKLEIKPGRYSYTIEKNGYKTIQHKIVVVEGKTPIVIKESPQALLRSVQFYIVNQDQQPVDIKNVFINGEQVFNRKLQIIGKTQFKIEIKNHRTIELEKVILPGQGPLTIAMIATKESTLPTNKIEREKAEREKAEREKAEREKAEREKAEREKTEREKAEREKAEREKAEREKAEREKESLNAKIYTIKCIRVVDAPLLFSTKGKEISLQNMTSKQNGEKFTLSISLPKHIKQLRIQNLFYFSEISLLDIPQEVRLTQIDTPNLIIYFQSIESGKVLEKISSLLYKENVNFSKNKEEKEALKRFLLQLQFEEEYQYGYCHALINELRLRNK